MLIDISIAQNVTPELLDKNGDRKFVKMKLDTQANTFLSNKNSYLLASITPPKSIRVSNLFFKFNGDIRYSY